MTFLSHLGREGGTHPTERTREREEYRSFKIYFRLNQCLPKFLTNTNTQMGFLSGSDGKESAYNVGTWVGKNPWMRAWQPTQVFLPGQSHGQMSVAGYSPRGCKESDMAEQLHTMTLAL